MEVAYIKNKVTAAECRKSQLIIGAGTSLANTNAANSNTLSDGQFLIWGDNGLARTLTTALSNPSAPGGEINYRFPAIMESAKYEHLQAL
jgi:hypothetical protein